MSVNVLIFNLNEAHGKGHPQTVMQELGITYQVATPQSMMDCWQFWNCENVPDPLPPFLTEFKKDPYESIGWGLSERQAEMIANYKKEA